MDMLVGYTGFVGSNLKERHEFDGVFNSKNISDAYGTNPDLCIYAGVRAEKFLANNDPKADMANIETAMENIKRIAPKRLVLISTIDVFKSPNNCDENTKIDENGLHAYGYNRYQLEKWCTENIKNCHIMRLPGLFGKNIKKNFIYDIIHVLPSVLNSAKFNDFSLREAIIGDCYIKQDNGFYKLKHVEKDVRSDLIKAFERLNFSALNFTDSRAVFQLYNLKYLFPHIEFAIKNDIKLLHLAVEPVSSGEIYNIINADEKPYKNEISDNPPVYDFKTIYSEKLNAGRGYIFYKQQILEEIKEFVAAEKQKI